MDVTYQLCKCDEYKKIAEDFVPYSLNTINPYQKPLIRMDGSLCESDEFPLNHLYRKQFRLGDMSSFEGETTVKRKWEPFKEGYLCQLSDIMQCYISMLYPFRNKFQFNFFPQCHHTGLNGDNDQSSLLRIDLHGQRLCYWKELSVKGYFQMTGNQKKFWSMKDTSGSMLLQRQNSWMMFTTKFPVTNSLM